MARPKREREREKLTIVSCTCHRFIILPPLRLGFFSCGRENICIKKPPLMFYAVPSPLPPSPLRPTLDQRGKKQEPGNAATLGFLYRQPWMKGRLLTCKKLSVDDCHETCFQIEFIQVGYKFLTGDIQILPFHLFFKL